jgi:hypothetical protein
VPVGPWSLHGDNNCFVKLRRSTARDLADARTTPDTTRTN